jgi:arginine kinase
MTKTQYTEMEATVSALLSGMEGVLKGSYFPLLGMTKEVQKQLIGINFLFKDKDRFLQAANACQFWPIGRGIYHNDEKNFLVWVNEEDHLRIISIQQGGDLARTYKTIVDVVSEIEKKFPFFHSDRFGFLTACPTNVGTTLTACVKIKLPKLALEKAKLYITAAIFNLEVMQFYYYYNIIPN